MEKLREIAKKAMLGIFALIFIVAVLPRMLMVREHLSYIVAFAAALIVLAGCFFADKKLGDKVDRLLERQGAVRVGLAIAIFCAVLSFGWVAVFRIEPQGDYATFNIAATDIANGLAPSNAKYLAIFPHILGYSTFLGLLMRLFGVSMMTAPLSNAAISVLSGLCIYILCLRWRGIRTAALAFILWSVCPSRILYNTMTLSEPFYTFLILLFLLVLSQAERTDSRKGGALRWALWGALGGVILTAVNASRPLGAVLIIAVLIYFLLLWPESGKSGPVCRAVFALALLVVYVVLCRCWNGYAEKAVGEKLPETPGYNIYVGFNTETCGQYSNEDMELLSHYAYDVYGNAAEAQAKMLDEAKARVFSGEIDFLELFTGKLRAFMGSDEAGAFYSAKWLSGTAYSMLVVLSNVHYYCLVILAMLGAYRLWQGGRGSVLMAPLYCIGLTMAHMLVEVAGRYHYSIIPMLVIVAAMSCRERVLENG